jgi:hypothetical protein
MKIRKGQTIKFSYPSDFTGILLILTGVIIGHGKAVREKWPIEMAEAPDDYLLVQRKDVYGNTHHHAVAPEDIIQEGVVINVK